MSFDPFDLISLAMLIPAIVLHEVAHGYVAYRLGDPTAKLAGRLSLNPIRHIDPFGTVLLPLLLWATGGPIFGYAKPVPISFRNSRVSIRRFDLLTGLAGPATNLVLAVIGGLLVRGADWLAVAGGGYTAALNVAYLLGHSFAYINLVLMFFNLIPIPPLDGSSILPIFLPDRALKGYYSMQRYSFVILLGLLWLVPTLTGFNPLGAYINGTVLPVLRALTGAA